MENRKFFYPAEILLPDFASDKEKMSKYAVIACDQFTSEPEYWEKVREIADDAPTTLDMILPEAYLDRADEATDKIHEKMEEYGKSVLSPVDFGMIYCERVLASNGKI